MDKTEILNIVNEPTKHIQLVKIDGKDSIVYSAKFVELLELIPTMLTGADMVDILDKIRVEQKALITKNSTSDYSNGVMNCLNVIDKYTKGDKE